LASLQRDADREHANGAGVGTARSRHLHTGALGQAKKNGWTVVSIKNDWKIRTNENSQISCSRTSRQSCTKAGKERIFA
jgi:hypothetical protein